MNENKSDLAPHKSHTRMQYPLFEKSARDISSTAIMLQESEERYRLLVENSQDAIFIVQDGTIKFPNPMALRLFGYSKEELTALPFTDLVHPDFREMVAERHEKRLFGKTPPSTYSYRILSKDGQETWVQHNASLVTWEGRQATVCNLRDITSLRKMEDQLQIAQKWEAIGRLGGGIAHDFNNILSSVIGFVQLSLRDISKGSILYYNLAQTLKAGYRAKNLIKRIHAFSDMSETGDQVLRVSPLITEVIGFLKSTLPTTITIRRYLKTTADYITADAGQIHQVLMNLCTNAVDAMAENGGILRITLANVEIDEAFAAGHPDMNPGLHLRLTVTDTGCGMPPFVLGKIFDPYFSSKESSEGTGLGLAVALGIVTKCSGTIIAESEPGKGSTFEVYLPVSQPELFSEIEMPDEQGALISLPTGHEHILFVDDDKALIRLMEKMLESLGYTVVSKALSPDALAFFRENPNMIDLLITDLKMADMTGDKLFQEIRAIRPGLPGILCTGYSDLVNEDIEKAWGFSALLVKPIDLLTTARTIRTILYPGGK